MKKTIFIQFKKLPLILMFAFMAIQGCNSTDEPIPPPVVIHKLAISADEVGSAIYLNGIYTGKVTPAEITVNVGEYTIGIGLKNSRTYLRKTVNVVKATETLNIALTDEDLQQPKTWKALFIGVNKVKVQGVICESEYVTTELDLAYEFFNWSFKEKVEDYSYNTIKWEIDRRDINTETVILNNESLITPGIIDNYITDIKKGDYDLIVTFFRGGAGSTDCFINNFIGIAWYDVTELNSDSSYFTIRYYDDVEGVINESKKTDPGMFIHEWLHTTAEMFFPGRGVKVPIDGGQVVHAAETYGYSFPWMNWYEDIISGQVRDGNVYSGIGPEAFLECSVRESATGSCP